jgi:hypothetical protein
LILLGEKQYIYKHSHYAVCTIYPGFKQAVVSPSVVAAAPVAFSSRALLPTPSWSPSPIVAVEANFPRAIKALLLYDREVLMGFIGSADLI